MKHREPAESRIGPEDSCQILANDYTGGVLKPWEGRALSSVNAKGESMISVGQNIKMEVDEETNTLHLEIDLSAKGHPSSTGKSEIIASSLGYIQVGNGIALNLNVSKK